ncbi:MAG: hypothetical protein K0U93_14650, partial [Gammaproteobacteria bacterium]|nr:hypothetical protein [Gammaproteobacteria bacterium]
LSCANVTNTMPAQGVVFHTNRTNGCLGGATNRPAMTEVGQLRSERSGPIVRVRQQAAIRRAKTSRRFKTVI